jgi:hypothetical protein
MNLESRPRVALEPTVTVRDVVEQLFASGASFQDVRRALKSRFNVKLDYTGADRDGGRAMTRRRRQIAARGLSVTLCVCGAQLAPGNTIGLCSVCLEKKWSD